MATGPHAGHRRPLVSAPPAPESWAPAVRLARGLWAPVERFLSIQAASGILLLVTSVIALVWASSPEARSYEALWHTPVGFTLGSLRVERDLHFVVNDVLMAVFFFVVGLEIRREIHRGELSEPARAALPVTAAIGGMLAPAGIYLALNHALPTREGWGVPMATDIAFAVGVLTLLGPRVPAALRILLLALAVVDDLGAIVVIALFYSSGIAIAGLLAPAIGLAVILALQKLGARSPWAYVAPAIVVWAGIYGAGIHPTLAGVLIGLVTPVRAWLGAEHFQKELELRASAIAREKDEASLLGHLEGLHHARREAVSPVDRLIHAYHPWVAFVIMPVFALANAGVPLSGATFEGAQVDEALGIALGLAIGKPLGIVLLPLAAARLGLVRLPRGVGAKELLVVGTAGGIGFTMALFIAELAFEDAARLEVAKMAVLAGSLVSALASLALGRAVLRAPTPDALHEHPVQTESEAEASTEL
jgi:NhaA family Na+:H+ antiporter